MIVKSILDTDLYKFTTSYAYMKLFPQARGTFEFFDRDLTEYPEDFVQKVYLELSNLGMLRLTNSELDYMTSNCRLFHKSTGNGYILSGLTLAKCKYGLMTRNIFILLLLTICTK